jgi:hypothetical protein
MEPQAELALHTTGAERSTLRERAHAILEEGETDTRIGLSVELLLLAFILGNVLTIMLETVPSINAKYHTTLGQFEGSDRAGR